MKARLALVAALVAVAGCGGGSGGMNSNVENEKPSAANNNTAVAAKTAAARSGKGADSGAAALRAMLTSKLEDHVYLVGIAVEQGARHGYSSKQFNAASSAVSLNTLALSQTGGQMFGNAARTQFMGRWQQHVAFLIAYARHQRKQDPAVMPLTIPGGALEKALRAVGDGRSNAFQQLHTAAMQMAASAGTVARAVASRNPQRFPGDAGSPAATLRARLTALLQEHVYLTGIAVMHPAAMTAVDSNSSAVAGVVGSAYGAKARKSFLQMWRTHVTLLARYAKANGPGRAAAKKQLARVAAQMGAFFAKLDPALQPNVVTTDMQGHEQTLEQAIAAESAGSPDQFSFLHTAASHMPVTADLLAGAIVKQFPKKFPS